MSKHKLSPHNEAILQKLANQLPTAVQIKLLRRIRKEVPAINHYRRLRKAFEQGGQKGVEKYLLQYGTLEVSNEEK